MHPLDGSFLKIRRARYHIDTANEFMKRFFNRKPYKIIDRVERDGQARYRILRFEQQRDIPPEIALSIGDICNNLRSALDHLLWQLWLLNDPSFDRIVFFPICDTEDIFKTKRIWGFIKGLSDVQRTILESLQPYKTGKPALSWLRDVNNSDKHRLIQIIYEVVNVDRLRITIDDSTALLKVPMPPIIPFIKILPNSKVENGTELARIPLNNLSRGTHVRVQSHAFVNFAFEGSNTAHGKIVKDSVDSMFFEVSRVVALFEPEFSNFGVSQFK
jgi:hypothetical protein